MTTMPKPSRETIISRPARLPPSNSTSDLCSPASPRVSPLITTQFSTNSNLPPSGLMLPFSSMLPSSSMLPNQPMPMHWPTQVPSGVSIFFLPAQCCHHKCQCSGTHRFPHGFPFFFCIIGLTSMLLLQGCVDPLVSGDGQTVSYQPQIHANTIRRSQEQNRCSHNL
jgi:hypothetical protein